MNNGNKYSTLNLEDWVELELQINKVKVAYMSTFKSAVERQQDLLCKDNLLAGLWTIESRFGGMGGTYDPVFWWRVNSPCTEPITLEFEVGEGLKLKKGRLTLAHLGELSEQMKALFTSEAGWYIATDAVLCNSSLFGTSGTAGFKGAAREIWLLGNEPEKYACLLCKFIRPYLTDEKVIKLFQEIDL